MKVLSTLVLTLTAMIMSSCGDKIFQQRTFRKVLSMSPILQLAKMLAM